MGEQLGERVEVSVLGRFALRGRELSVRTTRGAVLATLLSRCNQRVWIDELAEAVWPHARPATYRKAIQVAVFQLREIVGRSPDSEATRNLWLVSRPDAYELHLSDRSIDATRFEDLTRRGLQSLAQDEPARASALLREALDAWAEPFSGEDCEPIRGWVEHLRAAHRGAVSGALEADLKLGREDVGELERALAADPYDERSWAHLMVALYRRGRQAEALSTFRRARRLLVDALGVEPGPYLRRAEQEVLLQEGPLLAVRGTRRLDAGHRWPPPPILTRPMVLRDQEHAAVSSHLTTRRAVTIVGPPGVGKTTLATAVASTWRSTPSAWLALGEIPRSPGAVVDVANRLGVVSELAADSATFTHASAALVGDAPLLLVLDNAEHLVDVIGPFVAALLRGCPSLVVLATSRRPLGIDGEHAHQLRPFDVDASDLGERRPELSDAARYLAARSDTMSTDELDPTDIDALNMVARRVGGLALGLERAAVHVRRLSASELSKRLQLLDIDVLEPDLATAIEWSLDLLLPTTLDLLSALAHVETEWCLPRAEAIGGRLGFNRMDVAGQVGELVTHSLVVDGDRPGVRRIIEPIRDHLRRRAGPEIASRFEMAWAGTITEEVTEASALLEGADQAAGLAALHELMPEVRRAIVWAVAVEQPRVLAELLAGLRMWWWAAGTYADGETLHRIAAPTLERWQRVTPDDHRHWLVSTSSRSLARPGFAAPAAHVRQLTRQLEVARLHGSDPEISWVAQLLAAGLAFSNSEIRLAQDAARVALQAARRTNDAWLAGWALYASAIACGRSDPAAGLDLLEQATASFTRAGDELSAARVSMFRAHGMRIFGVTAMSDEALADAQRTCERLRAAPVTQLDCELGIAQNAHSAGQLNDAAERYRALVPRLTQVGDLRCAAVAQRGLGSILVEHGDLDGGSALVLHALEVFRQLATEDTEIAATHLVRADIAHRRGNAEQAARLLGRARALAAGSGVPLELRERQHLDELTALVRAELGTTHFDELTLDGRRDTLL